MNIVVFGGSCCTQEYYNKVYDFSKKNFNDKSINIITGGTSGTMEAVTKAAYENGIHTMAVALKKWQLDINSYNSEIVYFENEMDRLNYMIKEGDVYICLDGDIGTLAELFPTWIYVMDNNKKVYITSEYIKNTMLYMYENKYLSKVEYKNYINFVNLDDLKLCI